MGEFRSRKVACREYKVVDKLDRRTTFESVSDKESFKISMQLQARYEGACEVKLHMNAVVFAADIGGGGDQGTCHKHEACGRVSEGPIPGPKV